MQTRGGGMHHLPEQPLRAIEFDLALFEEPNRMEAAGVESAAAVDPAPDEDGFFRNSFSRQAELLECFVNQLPNVSSKLIVRHGGRATKRVGRFVGFIVLSRAAPLLNCQQTAELSQFDRALRTRQVAKLNSQVRNGTAVGR